MIIKKERTYTYDVKFYPNSPMKFTWGEFSGIRKTHGMSTAQFDHCFCCGHKFDDEEKMVVINVKGKGNRFACNRCLEKEAED